MAETAGTNWAGNYTYTASEVRHPSSVDDVRAAVREAAASGARVHAIGTRHCFNDIADTPGVHLAMTSLTPRFELDEQARTVTVSAGERYGDIALRLDAAGYALPNLASLPHISVAGAIATATHGSGDRNVNLAAVVAGLELVDGTGELVTLRRGDADFDGAVVGIGALGIITAVTLDVVPSFEVEQTVYDGLDWEAVLEHYDAITSSAYSVSMFTDWVDGVQQVWLKRRADEQGEAPVTFFGSPKSTVKRHPLPGVDASACTDQFGVPGPWYDRLPHFKLEFTPSNGEEIQSEYLVPRERAADAIRALLPLAEQIAPVLQVTELRTVAADELWLSSAYQRDVTGIHFTWKRDQQAVEAVLPAIEAALFPLGARPHWGKVFVDVEGVVPSLYPRFDDFRALASRFDPKGVFRNAYLDRLLG
ncbi:FAD-binding protein [Humibacter ginsenosidimutans]|uniref:FAD-binding protein n=1 Tax=Humibacter ginsenosidimutans TaxID=2599293 RepID=UPI001AEF94C4|nr:FAD-binding protein [Humibacter ginsenosidimutans]